MEEHPILLVEDNRFDEMLTLRLLARCNFKNVVVTRDGAEAYEYLLGLAHRGGEQDMLRRFILLDLKMPKVDGITLLKMIRANDQLKEVPVIVITSSIEERDFQVCKELNVLSYLNKPLTAEALEEALKNHRIR